MSTVDDARTAPEQDLDAGRMSFLQHLDELRRRLTRVVIALLLGIGLCYWQADRILDFLLHPVQVAIGDTLAVTRIGEAFSNKMKAAFLGAVVLSLPVLFYQLWAFVAPGLYRRERRWVVPLLTFGTSLFLVGAGFCYYVALPSAAKFLVEQGTQFKQVVTVDSAFGFCTKLLLGMGVVFEMPLVAFALAKLGILSAGFLRKHLLLASWLIFVVAAMITPTPDWVTCSVFALPMLGLYMLSIGITWVFGPKDQRQPPPKKPSGPRPPGMAG